MTNEWVVSLQFKFTFFKFSLSHNYFLNSIENLHLNNFVTLKLNNLNKLTITK